METKYRTGLAVTVIIILGQQSRTVGLESQPVLQTLIQAHGLDLEEENDGNIFLSANLTVVETHRGSDVTLNCRVKRNSDYGTISWFKRSEDSSLVLVSVGDEIYINDGRFSIIRPVLSMNWSLQIKLARQTDGGDYLCQTSHHPPSSLLVTLAVYQATADIVGGKEKVFRANTDVTIVCLIRDITNPPAYIFWYHNERMINYDQAEGVSVNVSNITNRSMKSVLTMRRVKQSQAGNYKCSPSTARSDSVVITVKHREHGALPEPVVNSVMRIKLKLTGYLLAYFVLLM